MATLPFQIWIVEPFKCITPVIENGWESPYELRSITRFADFLFQFKQQLATPPLLVVMDDRVHDVSLSIVLDYVKKMSPLTDIILIAQPLAIDPLLDVIPYLTDILFRPIEPTTLIRRLSKWSMEYDPAKHMRTLHQEARFHQQDSALQELLLQKYIERDTIDVKDIINVMGTTLTDPHPVIKDLCAYTIELWHEEKKPLVLVIDPSAIYHMLYSRILEKDYDVRIVEDIEQAEQLLGELKHLDTVIIDVLPGSIRLLQHIKAQFPYCAVVVASIKKPREELVEYTKIPIECFIKKPFFPDVLFQTLNSARQHRDWRRKHHPKNRALLDLDHRLALFQTLCLSRRMRHQPVLRRDAVVFFPELLSSATPDDNMPLDEAELSSNYPNYMKTLLGQA